MKKIYTSFFAGLILYLSLLSPPARAQCPGGQPNGGVAFDTSVAIGLGMQTSQIKLPKLNPTTAMITCVRLTVTMIGVVNHVGLQNTSNTVNNASFHYDRTDNMTGPGLSPALSNTFNHTYGPYGLQPYDGTPGAGTDYHAINNDTTMKAQMTRTITDPVAIAQFYGTDSLTYNHSTILMAYAQFSGNNSSSISTSSLVRFRLEYCTCPPHVLPEGLKNFTATKWNNSEAYLQWEAAPGGDDYFYEIEVSTDGHNFYRAGVRNKAAQQPGAAYSFRYSLPGNEFSRYYFRIKQRWANGTVQYSDVRTLEFGDPLFSNISLYPNPSTGQIGLKFISARAGVYNVEVSNAAGQIVVRKTVEVAATDYKIITNLSRGLYYVKLTEAVSKAVNISQVVVQ